MKRETLKTQVKLLGLMRLPIHTANSKKVVLRKSKIQITKYKIQEKVCHITHMSERLTSSL